MSRIVPATFASRVSSSRSSTAASAIWAGIVADSSISSLFVYSPGAWPAVASTASSGGGAPRNMPGCVARHWAILSACAW